MAIPLIVAAVVLFAAAYQNNLPYLMTNLGQDFGGYLKWLIALMAILAIGLIPKAKPVALSLLGLVILVLLIKNQGFFSNIQNIQGSIVAPPAPAPVSAPDIAPAAGPGVSQTGAPVSPAAGGSSAAPSSGGASGILQGLGLPSGSGPGSSIISKMFGG